MLSSPISGSSRVTAAQVDPTALGCCFVRQVTQQEPPRGPTQVHVKGLVVCTAFVDLHSHGLELSFAFTSVL